EYSKNLEGVTTTGNFEVQGMFKGIVDEEHIPKFNITINSDNASFKYPDLPKAVRNIFIDMAINNGTGVVEDTHVAIERASFTIDGDRFNMTSKITELLGNTKVEAHIDGKMDLANVPRAYPVPEDMDLKGILEADITTAFDMESIEREQYENTTTSGTMSVRDFEYTSSEMPKPVQIEVASMVFDPKRVEVGQLNARTGKTDFRATGTIDNFLGFLFNGEEVKGRFQLESDTFSMDDFMVEETITETQGEMDANTGSGTVEKIKIPSFLDCGINAKAQTVLYDNLVLKDVQGHLRIKDQKAILSDMTTSLFNGQVQFAGEVSTKEATPTFAMRLGMENLGISESFEAMELFQTIAPVAEVLKGKLDSDIELSGNLTDDLLPDMATLSGKVLAEILAGDLNAQQSKLWDALGAKLDFVKTDKLNLKGLKTALSFENGQVRVKPFSIAYEDIEIKIDGSHTFDKKMNYTATLDVPTKYLGNEVNSLIAQLDDSSLKGLTVPVTATIGGVYNKPSVTTDLTSGVKALTQQLIEVQKQKMVDKGTEKAKDLLGDILGGKKDSSATGGESTEEQVKDVLGGILGGNQKERDSTPIPSDSAPKDMVKEKAKDILGGLFGKKNDTVK
ncbi:MAG: AsmA-like C-terminal region-containing protein, partial [Flavobacteriaceae bacterium]